MAPSKGSLENKTSAAGTTIDRNDPISSKSLSCSSNGGDPSMFSESNKGFAKLKNQLGILPTSENLRVPSSLGNQTLSVDDKLKNLQKMLQPKPSSTSRQKQRASQLVSGAPRVLAPLSANKRPISGEPGLQRSALATNENSLVPEKENKQPECSANDMNSPATPQPQGPQGQPVELQDQSVELDNVEPNKHDILSGNGRGQDQTLKKYIGNIRFRQLVASKKNVYLNAKTMKDKRAIAQSCVDEVQQKGGRFLKRNKTSGVLEEMDNAVVLDKTSKAFRHNERKRKHKEKTASSTTVVAVDAAAAAPSFGVKRSRKGESKDEMCSQEPKDASISECEGDPQKPKSLESYFTEPRRHRLHDGRKKKECTRKDLSYAGGQIIDTVLVNYLEAEIKRVGMDQLRENLAYRDTGIGLKSRNGKELRSPP